MRADSLAIAGRETLYEHPGTGAVTELIEIVRRDRLEPLDADTALGIGAREPGPDSPPRTGSGDKPRLAVNARSKRAAVIMPAASRMFDDGGVQERVRLLRPATPETMARAELDASNWRRADEAHWRMLWEQEIAELPTHRESRFWLAAGLLLPVWDRLPAENMRVRRLATDTGETLIGRVLDAEQVAAVRTAFGLDGALSMTGAEAFEAVMGRGSALALANGCRLARRRIMGADRIEIEGPADTDTALLKRIGCTVEIVSCAPAPSPPPPRCSTAVSNAGRSPPEPGVRTAGAAPAGIPIPAWRSSPAPRIRIAPPPCVSSALRLPFPQPDRGSFRMTAQTLPDDPNYCFVPAYDIEDEVQQIRIVIEGMSGYVPTALVALTVSDAEEICDKLNRRLGLDRDAWTAIAAKSRRAEEDDPDGDSGIEPSPTGLNRRRPEAKAACRSSIQMVYVRPQQDLRAHSRKRRPPWPR